MAVALNTSECCTLPHFPRCAHPIDQCGYTELFVFCSALIIVHGVAMEGGCNKLLIGRVREKVTCKLLDRELIVRHVLIERFDHPVAIAPNRSRSITFVTFCVRVSSEIEPP